MQQIRTKWHQVMPLVEKDEVYLTAPSGGTAPHRVDFNGDLTLLKSFLHQVDALPHFVIDCELIELAQKDAYQDSLLAMKRGGVLRLPYPAMIVEFSNKRGDMTQIVILRDLHHKGVFSWENETTQDPKLDFYGIRMSIETDQEGSYLCLSPAVFYLGVQDRDGTPWVKISAQAHTVLPESEALHEYIGKAYHNDVGSVFCAAAAGYLLMSTAGVEKEVIETERINKKRELSGKPAIPRHTFIRIGHVYRSAESLKSDEYVARKSPRPHWRRGHIRPVRFGQGRTQIKDVYIYPKLVAYHGEAEPTRPEYMVVN